MTPVPSLNLVCTGDEKDFEYITADDAKEKGLDVKKLSGTKFRPASCWPTGLLGALLLTYTCT